MKKTTLLLIVGTFFLGNISHLHAQILNGSFGTGDFSDWTVVGGTSGGPVVLTSLATLSTGATPLAPPTGSTQAFIQSTDGDSGATSATVDAIDAALQATTPPGLTASLPPTTNSNPLYETGTFSPDNGQAIYQTFTVSSAATLTFAYSYQTNDGYPYDSVGYVLDGTYYPLMTTPPYPESGPNLDPTAYTFVAPISLSAGAHTLGFVAYNTDGPADSTSLFIADVSTSDVPEPGAWVLLLLGCAGLVFVRKLRPGIFAI